MNGVANYFFFWMAEIMPALRLGGGKKWSHKNEKGDVQATVGEQNA